MKGLTGLGRCGMGLIGAAALLLIGVAEAPGQDPTTPLANKLLDCAGIEDDAERLGCFDAVTAPLAGIADEEAEEQAVQVFRGEDDWDSETLQIDQPWRVTWTAKGNILTLELRDQNGELVSVIGNQIGRGGGSTDILDPGVWRLAVRSIGAWELRVIEEEG